MHSLGLLSDNNEDRYEATKLYNGSLFVLKDTFGSHHPNAVKLIEQLRKRYKDQGTTPVGNTLIVVG